MTALARSSSGRLQIGGSVLLPFDPCARANGEGGVFSQLREMLVRD